jgi:2-oxoacid dehydrogenases acyltransferase (catalytic domain)
MFTKNINYSGASELSPWRKLSLSSWRPTGDSSCYCLEDIEVAALLTYAQEQQVNFHTILIKAIGATIALQPKINATVRFGKIYARKDISIFVHNVPKTVPDDLDGMLYLEPQTKSLSEINSEYKQKLLASHRGNSEFAPSKKILKLLPAFCTKSIMNLFSFFAYKLNTNISIFEMPQNAFGSVMLTSVGSLGITQALCPIAPYTCVPMVISVGKVRDIVVAEAQEMTIKTIISFGFTFDHRIMDGIHFAAFFETLKQFILNPKTLS